MQNRIFYYEKCIDITTVVEEVLSSALFRGSIPICSALSTCSDTWYRGLSAELDILFSCHACTDATGAPDATTIPFVSVEADDNYTGVKGISSHTESNFCHKTDSNQTLVPNPDPTTANKWNFPTNCALGVLNNASIADASDATVAAPTDGTKLKAFCAACKPGHLPKYNNITGANVKVVYQCQA